MVFDSLVLKPMRVAGAAMLSLALLTGTTMLAGEHGFRAEAQEGPASVADLSSKLIDSVVNISTSQTVGGSDRNVPRPDLPEGSPFQEFFDEFFDQNKDGAAPQSRQVQSLGSGSSSPTTTSSKAPTKLPSISMTARRSRPRSSAMTRRPISRC